MPWPWPAYRRVYGVIHFTSPDLDLFRHYDLYLVHPVTFDRVSTTPGNAGNTGNLLEFEIPRGNTGNLPKFC